MTIYNVFDVAGTEYSDSNRITVKGATGENNTSSSFTAIFPNFNGEHKTDFSVGQEVTIKSDQVNPATTKIFAGTIEDIKFTGRGVDEIMTLSGRDFLAVLMDATVQPVVYNAQEVSVIVKDIIANNVTGITTTNVDTTSKTIQRISFNHLSVYDSLVQLAKSAGYIFYVDVDKDLHFELRSSTSSGVTLQEGTNIIKSIFRQSDAEMANEVWVYGDRQLSAAKNSFTADGGSEHTLTYKPHNTQVFVAGSTAPKTGNILNMVSTPPAGVDYLIDYDTRLMVFVSGTDAGNNIPASGDAVVVDYQRSTPIVKLGRNRVSIDTYKKKVKVIVDKNIKDPQMATDILKEELAENGLPRLQGTLNLQGVVSLTAGNTVVVDVPNQGVSSQTYDILETSYNFNPKNNFNDSVLTVKVSKRIKDVTDTLKQLMLDVKKLQTGDIDTSDIITRLETSAGSLGIRVKNWTVNTRVASDGFILGHSINGVLGSPQIGIGSGQIVLGSNGLSAYSSQQSGGTF